MRSALRAMLVGIALVLLAPAAPAPVGPASGKWAEVDKTDQVLRAYQGNTMVFESPVSTGREGHRTPNGIFLAGAKFRMHHSRRYHHAPMPYSVQIAGNDFIHGFRAVPARPASHGCIRLPLEQAQRFYTWVEPGTPIVVWGRWPGRLTQRAKGVREAVLRQRTPGALAAGKGPSLPRR
jgi:hypothetical protein